MNIIDLMPESPFRPVDWRWKLAGILRRQRKATHQFSSDRWVNRAIKIREFGDAHPDSRPVDLESLGAALRVHESSSSAVRDVVQARLLAGQPPPEIAVRCGLSAETIEAYERVLFNVCDRLQSPSYITRAIDQAATLESGTPSRAVVLMNLAYLGGSQLVEIVVPYLDENLADAQAQPHRARAQARLDRLIRRAIAVRSSKRAADPVSSVRTSPDSHDHDGSQSHQKTAKPMTDTNPGHAGAGTGRSFAMAASTDHPSAEM